MSETATLLERARAGDGEAFGELTEPFRRELQVHCYRMLGSLQDAEDAVQDALVAAWQALADFEGRSSVRTWLYRIATNRCLSLRRAASRRPAKEWNVPSVVPPEPTSYGEVPWLEPYPDSLLDGALQSPLGPEARYEQSEAVSLAFITALQTLPPRQLAVLILRDVLGLRAKETAEMLDSTVDTANSLLKRARSAVGSKRLASTTTPDSPRAAAAEEAIVRRFVEAYEAADLDGVVALLTDDAFVSMPPMPFEYEGRDTVARFLSSIFDAGRRFDLVATRANGQPAFGAYLRSPDGMAHGAGIYVLTLNRSGDAIAAITRFENTLLPWFGLPRTLRGRPAHP